MAEEKEKDSKTELPTETKISNALEKGNVAFSREITNAASLVAAIIVRPVKACWAQKFSSVWHP